MLSGASDCAWTLRCGAITGDFRSMGVVAQCDQCGLGVGGGGVAYIN